MKSYFSQLAKQSGIRFDGRNAKPRQFESAAPLHQEKTVLVEPDLSEIKSPKTFQQNALPNFSPTGKPISKQTKIVTAETSAPEKINPTTPILENSQTEIVFQNPSENLPETQSLPTETSKKIVFKSSDAPIEINSSDLPKERKEYFKQTSEILEKGAANPQEIQQILLREVQEWVSDAPTFDETEIIETNEVSAKVSPLFEPEKSVVREVSANRQDARQDLEEQNFNLSIGTISIVIEDAEKPSAPQNVPPKTVNESPKTERQFSRLRRHYL